MQEEQTTQVGNTDGNPTDVRADDDQQNQGNVDDSERVSDSEVIYRPEGPKFYTALGAAIYLEWDEKTIRNWIKNSKLRAQKIGGSWQIAEDDLNKVYVQRNLEKKREADGKSEGVRSAKEQGTIEEEPQPKRQTEREVEEQPDARSDYRPESIKQRPEYVELVIENEKLKAAKAGSDEVARTKDELLRERGDRIKVAEDYTKNLTDTYQGRLQAMQSEMEMVRKDNDRLILLTAPKEEVEKRGVFSRLFGGK